MPTIARLLRLVPLLTLLACSAGEIVVATPTSAEVAESSMPSSGMLSATPSPSPNTAETPQQQLTPTPSSEGIPTAVAPGISVGVLEPSAEPLLLTFTSGDPEQGRLTITLRITRPGIYDLVLENANPPSSGAWLVWDFLQLAKGSRLLWSIGSSDAPPDYSELAFAEFCDPQGDSCESQITAAGVTSSSAFRKDLNDTDHTLTTIRFTLTQSDVADDLALTLSTLFSTHDTAPGFVMRVSIIEAP
jgi:hypothetical protein